MAGMLNIFITMIVSLEGKDVNNTGIVPVCHIFLLKWQVRIFSWIISLFFFEKVFKVVLFSKLLA